MSRTKVTPDLAVIATQAEAEAGAVATALMTPQRTAQAIAALAGGGGGGWNYVATSPLIFNQTYTEGTGIPATATMTHASFAGATEALILISIAISASAEMGVFVDMNGDNGYDAGISCVPTTGAGTGFPIAVEQAALMIRKPEDDISMDLGANSLPATFSVRIRARLVATR